MSSLALPSLPRSTPEAQGIASSAVLRFVDALDRDIHETHSFMLLRHGSVIAEGWWAPYRADYRHAMFSVSKSFTATAVGLAVGEGRFALADSVAAFFPEALPLQVDAHLAALTVRDLLTMSTGHTDDSWLAMLEQADGDWIKAFFQVPTAHTPGSRFLYDNGATYMLAAILHRTTGMDLVDYLRPRLFEPLGIVGATWEQSPQGIAVGAYGLSICTEDLARFGQLHLQRGMWNERRLLPEAWIDSATRVQMLNGSPGDEDDSTQGYGYQFWRCRHNAYRASGVFGQYCVVMPDQDAVVAFTAGVDIFDAQRLLDAVWTYLLPAMQPSPLSPSSIEQEALAARVSSLGYRAVSGQSSAPISAHIEARTYQFDANPLGLETFSMRPAPSGWIIDMSRRLGDDVFACGFGMWQRGTTALFGSRLWAAGAQAAVAVSGAWTADDCFTMQARLVETAFAYILAFTFVGDEVLLEVQVNVTLESPAPLLLTGRWQEASSTARSTVVA